jgi:hypothetical protein
MRGCRVSGSHGSTISTYSRYKLREKLEYMHENPVQRGLVKNAREWIWSSFWFYEKGELGLVKIDPV